MKFRPAFLFCGIVLMTAPAWADRIVSSPSTERAPGIESFVNATETSGFRLNAPVNAGLIAAPAPPVALFDGVKASFDAWDSKSFAAEDGFFHAPLATELHGSGLSAIDFYERGSSTSNSERTWHRDGFGKGDNGAGPVTVPEPGALPLVLLGLATVGFLGRRRRDSRATA